MDLLDVSVISAKGYRYIPVVCDYFTKYTEAYPLKDKTAHSVADALMDIWLPRYGFPLFLHSDQGKEFDNAMIHKLSELLGTVKTKTTPYHPRSDGLVERFNRTLLAMLAMFVSQVRNKEPRTVRNATTIVKRWRAPSPLDHQELRKCWTLRYYPPARKNKLCSPWIGPYKIVRAPREWVVGIQADADARIVYAKSSKTAKFDLFLTFRTLKNDL